MPRLSAAPRVAPRLRGLLLGVVVVVAGGCGAAARSTALPAGTAPAGGRAYVCNFASDALPGTTITPIDLAAGRTAGRVTIGSLPSAVATTPGGGRLLVVAQGADVLVVLDTASDAVIGRVPTGLEPDAVAVTPDGRTAVVADLGDGTVTPVDLSRLRARRPIAVGSRPDAVAVTPDGRTAVVADFGDRTVTLVDLSTMTAGPRVPVGNEPDAVAVTPDGTTAVVADFGDGTVTPVDLATRRAGSPVAVGPGPTSVAMAPTSPAGGPAAWVAVGASLVPVAIPGLVAGAPVAVGHLAEALAVDGGGHRAWVAGLDGAVTPIDLATGHAGRSVGVKGRPSAIAVAPPWH